MSRECQVTGKRVTTGNNVSHANNKTRRRFKPNLHERRFWVASENRWVKLPFTPPEGLALVAPKRQMGPGFPDAGLRLVDVNEDGACDVLFSNGERYSLHLFKSMDEGWSIELVNERRGAEQANSVSIPPIVRPDGTSNGAWFHSGHLWVQNEDTATLKNLVDRRSFEELLRP